MAGRISRHRTLNTNSLGSTEPQSLSADLAQRHFLAFHTSVSRLSRIKFQLAVNASLEECYHNNNNSNNNDKKAILLQQTKRIIIIRLIQSFVDRKIVKFE